MGKKGRKLEKGCGVGGLKRLGEGRGGCELHLKYLSNIIQIGALANRKNRFWRQR